MRLKHINGCFVCGQGNPQGLKACFALKDGRIRGEFTPNKTHQGAKGLLHGGVVCALLDEAMAALINAILGEEAPTAALEVRFKRPARLNEKLIVKASLIRNERRIRLAQATVEREDGALIAKGTGKFLRNFKLM